MLRGIEAERVRNGWSKEELANKLGISMKTYYNWINEETDISGVALVRMSKMFGTSVECLIEGMSGVADKKGGERG